MWLHYLKMHLQTGIYQCQYLTFCTSNWWLNRALKNLDTSASRALSRELETFQKIGIHPDGQTFQGRLGDLGQHVPVHPDSPSPDHQNHLSQAELFTSHIITAISGLISLFIFLLLPSLFHHHFLTGSGTVFYSSWLETLLTMLFPRICDVWHQSSLGRKSTK